MIDLRKRDLPDAVEVDGKSFSVQTDYRAWIAFAEELQRGKNILEIFDTVLTKQSTDELVKYYPWSDEMLTNTFKALKDFFINENATPTGAGTDDKLIDYVLDGEYIYGSFMAVYGIDLIETELHWHKFKALLFAMPPTAKIKEIMSYRGYTESHKKEDAVRRELKASWTLPHTETAEEEKAKADFEALFEE